MSEEIEKIDETEKKDDDETPRDVVFSEPDELKEISVEERQEQIRSIQTKASKTTLLERIDENTRSAMENLDALAGFVYMASLFVAGYLMHSGKVEAWVILGFGMATGLFKQKIPVGPVMKILQRGREENKGFVDAVKTTLRMK